jgi:ribosomal protein S18 acetylase RimI-like enzyme
MNAAIAIKRAIVSDLAAFRRIRLEALQTEPENFASAYEDWAVMSDEEWLRRMQEPIFLAFQAEEPVGIMGLIRQSGLKMRHRADVIMVYVRSNLRGSGIAGDLMKVAVEEALSSGIRQLELHVSAENPAAIRFYERQGFVEIGRIPAAAVENGREVDDVVMARRLI